jgi:hypothetical protein
MFAQGTDDMSDHDTAGDASLIYVRERWWRPATAPWGWRADPARLSVWHRSALARFVTLPPSLLEQRERLTISNARAACAN